MGFLLGARRKVTLKQDEKIRQRYKDECLAVEKGEVCEFKLHHDGPHSWQLPLKSTISQFVSGLQIEDEFEEF